jgi:acetylornithine deacetylase/succinyl-diaminopimelate desuccinylase-like protein
MHEILRRKKQGLHDEVIKFTQDLVKQPSLSLSESEVAELVLQRANSLGYDKVIRDDYGNVVTVMYGRENAPTVLLNCHMDTMPAGETGKWTEDPHSAKIQDGKLYGCGSGDCKAGLAAQIYVGALLKRSLLPLQGNLIVAATVSQERGGNAGVRGLIEKTLPELNLKPDYVLLGEPTGLGLYYGHDGWAEIDITVESPNMFDVDDAAVAIFDDLKTRMPSLSDNEHLIANNPLYSESNGIRRATIGMSRRISGSEQVDNVLGQLEHQAKLVAQQSGNVAVKAVVRQENEQMYTGTTTVVKKITHAWSIDPFSPIMEKARSALSVAGCTVNPGKWRLGRLGMGTAGGLFTTEFKIPTIGYGPGNEEVVHAPNEYVEIDKISEALYGTAAIVHSIIGIPVFGWTSDEI